MTQPSPRELYSWTFTKAAIAPCFVRDVLEMDAEVDFEFFWLGRVPCRTVQVVGILVGVDEYDSKVRLRVDDGTGAIDCDCFRPAPATTSKPSGFGSSKKAQSQTQSLSSQLPKTMPKLPFFRVGMTVSTTGRIALNKFSRNLKVEFGHAVICRDANDELYHWKKVMDLHRSHYSLSVPFVIPTEKDVSVDTVTAQREQETSTLTSSAETQQTPTTTRTWTSQQSPSASSVASSSVHSGMGSSPVRASTSTHIPSHPPRLAHPSKLRSKDLTDVTFSYYVKHYLFFAPPFRPGLVEETETETETETEESYGFRDSGTPTPRRRKRKKASLMTPRAREKSVGPARGKGVGVGEGEHYGFTLSYLRRVPLLAGMAKAVVYAEDRRRRRKAAQVENGRSTSLPSSFQPSPNPSNSDSKSTEEPQLTPESAARKTKRLFQKTIRELFRNGSIILWSGPKRPCWHASSQLELGDGSNLDLSSGSSAFGRPSSRRHASARSSSPPTLPLTPESSEGESESYLPTTPQILSPHVFAALTALTSPSPSSSFHKPNAKNTKRRPPTHQGPKTAEAIARYLRESDGQMGGVGVWSVEEALGVLCEEGRVFGGEGGWAVCV